MSNRQRQSEASPGGVFPCPPADAPPDGLQRQGAFMEAIARLAGGAAHEINNPLTVISGRAQLMMESADTQEQKKIWRSVFQQAGRISEIVSDLMAFATPVNPTQKNINIQILLENEISRNSSSNHPNAKAPRFDKHIEGRLPDVWADPAQVELVIAELICNAITFSGKEPYIELSASALPNGTQVLLTVRDHGPGMDAQTLANAFVPFYSSLPAGRRRGLGLPLAWRRVVSNHGWIWIESEPGKGTAVRVLLPAAIGRPSQTV